jgi:hypothetical protein
MRIYDDRYNRERLRFHVALHFIRLEARTQTIRRWTGLTDDRIRKLYRSYLADGPVDGAPPLARHRGKSPHRAALFLRSVRARRESALLASLYRLIGALPERRRAQSSLAQGALVLPSLRRAELLCQAYDTYRALIGDALLTFEHAVFLFTTLAQGTELACGICRECRALVVIDRWALPPALCELCAGETAAVQSAQPASVPATPLARESVAA